MAINWTYNNELALALRNATAGFLELYENACTGTFVLNGKTYAYPAEALTDIKADAVTAYAEMNAAIDAIKDWAIE